MSSLPFEFDLDSRVDRLELEWRDVLDAYAVARSDYMRLAACKEAELEALDVAREHYEQCEARRQKVLDKIDSLERRSRRFERQ